LSFEYLFHFNRFNTYFEIPFLQPAKYCEAKDNLTIVYNDQDLEIPDSSNYKSVSIEANLKKVSIFYKDLAYFEISKNGKEIRVKELFKKNSRALFISKFLNHVIPFSLYQNKKLMIHGSGVSKNGRGVLFIGGSGSGKSSLSASLKDFKIIAEDSVIANFENKNCYVSTGFPLVKLTTKVAKILNFKKDESIKLPGDRLSRSYYPIKNFSTEKVLIDKCYILEWGDKFDIKKIEPKNFLANFLFSTYSSIPVNSCKVSSEILHRYASQFLSSVKTYKLTRNKKNLFNNNEEIIEHFSSTQSKSI
tara:strand:+ start:653 stop:1567 length:915 start_codon:yes stop_codon:yes gene_type:complete